MAFSEEHTYPDDKKKKKKKKKYGNTHSIGINTVPTDTLVTAYERREWEKRKKYVTGVKELFSSQGGHDTVGAVAVDSCGNVACATSTGGIRHKMVGLGPSVEVELGPSVEVGLVPSMKMGLGPCSVVKLREKGAWSIGPPVMVFISV
ncbi:hypothetical protein CRUP_006224 [Coryphaenoides rupestris]|nr:hypothetical protein CRUP_006224 [Coryphaenoides rupestris]